MQEIVPDEPIAVIESPIDHEREIKQPNPFYPHGAIAFFIALVALCLVIWFGIYYIMLQRI